MRARALMCTVALLVGSAEAQPTGAPGKVSAVPPAHVDLVVGAVAARDLPPRLASAARPGLDEVVKLLRANRAAEAQRQWTQVVPLTGLRSEVDVNALIQWVLRQSYLQTNEDLRLYADKVRYFNEAKKALRDELARLRDERTAARGLMVVPYRPDGTAVKTGPTRPLTKIERDQHVRSLEEKLNSVGDDAQLANVDLQDVLQKQQQTLQMMSNVSKMLHDTAMAIIRKIGG